MKTVLVKDIKAFFSDDVIKGGQAAEKKLLLHKCPICKQESVDPDSGLSMCDCIKCLPRPGY